MCTYVNGNEKYTAIRFYADSEVIREISQLLGLVHVSFKKPDKPYLILEHNTPVAEGDWVVKDRFGRVNKCTNAVFSVCFEKVSE